MLQRKVIETSIVGAIKAQAKIAIDEKSKTSWRNPSYVVTTILNQIDILNASIDRDTRFIEGHNVDDIQIIEELSYLITPLVVSNNPQDRSFIDLKFEEEVEGTFDYSLFMDAQHSFRRFFKKNTQSGMIDIMSRKTLTSFDEIKDKVCLVSTEGEGEGRSVALKWNKPTSVSEHFWPYFVEADMVRYQLDTELYSNDFDEKYINAWIRDRNFDSLGGANSSYTTVTK
jgi:hypothetical protein